MGVLKPIKVKKSGFEDSFFFIAVLFTICIFILIAAKAWNEIKTPLDTSITNALPNNSGVNITDTFSKVTSTINVFDKLIPLLIIGLIAFALISVTLFGNHPIMIVVGVIMFGVAILLAVIYANIYEAISTSPSFSDVIGDFTISSLFMQYLPYLIVIIFIGVIIVTLWAKSNQGGNL